MIALDSNLFIYMLEANREFGDYARQVFLAVEGGSLSVVASELVFFEVLSHASLDEDAAAAAVTKLQAFPIKFMPVTKQILLTAAHLRRVNALGALDSLHVSTALVSGCTAFVTNDQALLKKAVPEITLVGLGNFSRGLGGN